MGYIIVVMVCNVYVLIFNVGGSRGTLTFKLLGGLLEGAGLMGSGKMWAMVSMFGKGALVVANKANSFNGTILGEFLRASVNRVHVFSESRGGRSSVHRRFRTGVPRIDSGVGFFVNSIESLTSIGGTVRNMSCVFRTTTLGRIPSYRFFPVRTIGAGILNASGILATTVSRNIGAMVYLSASGTTCPMGTVKASGTVVRGMVITGSEAMDPSGAGVYYAHCKGIVYSHNSMVPL